MSDPRDVPLLLPAIDPAAGYVSHEWLQEGTGDPGLPGNLCVLTGQCDSMRPVFSSGDPLLIDRSVTQFGGDAMYFFRVGCHTFVKLLQSIPGEGILVISANPSYERWTTERAWTSRCSAAW